MAIPYDKYYQSAMSRYAPQREADIAQASAGLADKGLLASTGGQGALADVRNKYYAAAANEANQNAQWQSAFDEQRKQAARQTALQWWDAINSLALSKKNAGYNDKALYWANTPKWYRSYQTTNGLKYGDGKGEVMRPMMDEMPMMKMMGMMDDDEMPMRDRIGDGKGKAKQPSWVNYAAHQEDLGTSLAERQFNSQQDLARDQLALEERRLNESIRQSRLEGKRANPWAEMMSYITETTMADKDDNAANGIQRAFLPSEVLNNSEASWGFDVMEMARKGDEKAIAVIKLLYPKTWAQRLGMGDGPAQSVPGADLWRNPDGSAASIQNWQPESSMPWLDRLRASFTSPDRPMVRWADLNPFNQNRSMFFRWGNPDDSRVASNYLEQNRTAR